MPASTSLVLKGETVLTRCPRTPFDVVALEAPELRYPATCRTWACDWCGPHKARLRAQVIAWAQPKRFVTLTKAPDDWQAVRQKVRKLALTLRSQGYEWEVAWTVERGSRTGMKHVHLLQHGSYVPQRELQKTWGAIVDIRKIHGKASAAKYALKEAGIVSKYAMKGASTMADHLELNGGRGCHLSRRYLHGKRTAEVEALIRAQGRRDQELTWVLVPVGEEPWRR